MHIETNKEYWEMEYNNNYATYLCGEDEKIRYKIISESILNFTQKGNLLDVGCGAGILNEYLNANFVINGIDISENAINLIKQKCNGVYEVADAESYIPKKYYDVILFNEVLYYFKEADVIINKYAKRLKKNGIIVLSIYYPNEGHRYYNIFCSLIKEISELGYKELANRDIFCNDLRWKIIVLSCT